MTAFQNDAAYEEARLAARSKAFMNAKEDNGVRIAEVVGVVGGVLGAVASYANGASATSAIVGAIAGGAAGYAMGSVVGTVEGLGTSAKILSGAMAGTFGAGVGSLTTDLINGLGKVSGL